MRKYTLVLLIILITAAAIFLFRGRRAPLQETLPADITAKECSREILQYLKARKDDLVSLEADKLLAAEPDNLCAWWARAEVLRRKYKFKDAESILLQILGRYPNHAPTLITLAYIRYHDANFSEAQNILKQVLEYKGLDNQNKALAYMLLGSINAKKSSLGGFLRKLTYGTRIRGYFEKALSLAPELTEVHLGLGSFYLMAPKIAGGDIERAVQELEEAVRLAPDFATANARLAQAYKKKGDLEKYNLYLGKAKALDPENEVLKEIE
jgi:tetratricopeptide (TPR) repeat protein